jgi:hypothetical protein
MAYAGLRDLGDPMDAVTTRMTLGQQRFDLTLELRTGRQIEHRKGIGATCKFVDTSLLPARRDLVRMLRPVGCSRLSP